MSVFPVKQTFCRRMAMVFLVLILNELITPSVALALTGGPSQPEVHGFEPVGTSDMVDLATGDFNYNIPLMDAGGYPINISYHAGASADDEGSWVGLGWSLTPGAMNRDMRGLPDDFKGDNVKKEFNIKDDVTVGINAGVKVQYAGFYLGKLKIGKKKIGVGISVNYNLGGFMNSYKGFGVDYSISPSFSVGEMSGSGNATKLGGDTKPTGSSLVGSLNTSFKYNSQSGLDTDLGVGISFIGLKKVEGKSTLAANVNIGFNSRQGLKDLTFGSSLNQSRESGTSSFDLGSGSVSFANRTYVPTSAMPMINESQTFHGTVGTEAWAGHPSFQLRGYKSVQRLRQKTKSQAAYGYLHSQTAQQDAYALMDYNKEKQMPYRSTQPHLPLSVGTYDLFSAAGQGVSGQFRAMRNDVGTFRTPNNNSQSQSLNVGFELGGLPSIVHGGYEIKSTDVSTVAGDWDGDKGAASHLTFTDQTGTADAAAYEPVFIKNTGESATSNRADFQDKIGDNKPIALKLKVNRGVAAEDDMRAEQNAGSSKGSLSAFSGAVKREKREIRAQVFSYLTAAEAAKVGVDKTIKSYPLNDLNNATSQTTPIKISRSIHPAHHISEISVTQGDGSRYVYGIPAYNLMQEEATFAVAGSTSPNSLIDYIGAKDGSATTGNAENANNCITNKAGRDNYYDAQTLPPFAHSYLLTGVVSSDYVDVGNDGITDDDLGTNVKINYTKMDYTYKWRTPYTENMARHNAGYRNDTRDDKASYVYGEKEVWYTHSIETKTMIAKFFLENRQDGLGVQGRNGGKDESNKLQRLTRIELYSKSNLLKGDAIPIKTVHFVYDYSLCKKAPNITTANTEGGKLTLRRIYFTYGKNTSGELNKYKFFYNGDVVSKEGDLISSNNFDYDIDNYDRWGSYKERGSNLNNIPNKYFPYATQIKADADKYAKGWNLNKVALPSGGWINVEYESDDYAYVQDKRAGQMLPILGFSRQASDAPDNKLYDGDQSRFLHIDITAYKDKITNVADFQKRFLQHVNQIYFSCNVYLKDDPATLEDIKGYFDFDNSQNITFKTENNRVRAVIPMAVCPSGINMNPIAKIALQTMRLELPNLVYQDYEEVSPNKSLKSILGKLGGVFPEIWRNLRGFEKYARDKSWVKSVYLNESFVRLANPNYKKLGGGSRVKSIEVSNYALNDGINSSSNPNDAKYGQTYDYTTQNPDNNEPMSSGVASYEPMVGNEENLFREPVNYEEKIRWAPDNTYYMEKPFGESLFPSPSVVYSSVKVKSIEPEGLKRTGTGYTLHEFFTAKDFPTVVDYTSKQEKSYNPNASFTLASFFKIDKRHHVGVSQGYTIEVNDMHGKPKAEYVRNAKDVDISWTKYDYRQSDPHHLKNDGVDIVNTAGVIKHDGTIGYDFDIWQDMQQDKTVTQASGMSVNTELFEIFGVPIWLPPTFPTLNRDESVFRSAVTTKFVKRFGILNKVTKMENGSTVSTENLLFDSETGQPLLTKTQNEFRDEMYQFSYPAHWAYDEGMGQAYKNIGLKAEDVDIDAVGKVSDLFSKYFVPGDDLLVEQNGEILSNKYNIVMVGGSKRVIDPLGAFLPEGTYSIKIIRSGRRNQASAAIASVVSRKDPRRSDSQGDRLVFDNQILTAQAATFRDDWSVKSGRVWSCKKDTKEILTEDKNLKALINALGARDVNDPTLAPTVGEIINDKEAYFLNLGQYVRFNELTHPNNEAAYTRYEAHLNDNCLFVLEPLDPTQKDSYFSLTNAVFNPAKPKLITCTLIKGGTIDIKISLICESCGYQCKDQLANTLINPYQLGIKGNWRPDAAYALYTPRTGPLSTTSKKIRTDGDVVNYENFWTYDALKAKFVVNPAQSKWVKTNTITQYDDKGNDIENADALNIYSSALFRYKNTLASAVAANAKLREIAFDGFEDYGFSYNFIERRAKTPVRDIALLANNNNAFISCGTNHFDFAMNGTTVLKSNLTDEKAHTGKFSFKIDAATKTFSRNMDINTVQLLANEVEGTVVSDADHRVVKRVLPSFGLSKNKSYLISAWLSTDGNCTPNNINKAKIKITMTYPDRSTSSMECLPTGTIVEGWQRVETNFITNGTEPSAINIELINETGQSVYMDDFRILPTDGKMKSFVYDARTLRLVAQLDENNYATFYEYDDEGTLVRTKRETERGIVTIQENRSTLYRKQSQ
jgi:hypothetical protein